LATFTKQPNDVLDYDVDMTDWFQSIPLDEIQSVAVTVTSYQEVTPTLVVGPTPHPATEQDGANAVRFKVWLGGGTDQTDYVVTCVVLTEQDRRKEIDFKIKVRDK